MANFFLPVKEPLIDPRTGRVHPQWQDFFNRLNDLLNALTFTNISGTISLAQLVAHASRHQQGGTDAIKLDDLATPDDNTDLNASTTRHGLLPKLSGVATDVLHGDGAWGPP